MILQCDQRSWMLRRKRRTFNAVNALKPAPHQSDIGNQIIVAKNLSAGEVLLAPARNENLPPVTQRRAVSGSGVLPLQGEEVEVGLAIKEVNAFSGLEAADDEVAGHDLDGDLDQVGREDHTEDHARRLVPAKSTTTMTKVSTADKSIHGTGG